MATKFKQIALMQLRFLRNPDSVAGKMYGDLLKIASNLNFTPLGDNIRWLQMELIAQEIERKEIHGATAELDVYRGGFTKFISKAFKNRRYYFLDTPEGFAEHQIISDGRNFGALGHDFRNTSVSAVMDAVDKSSGCELIVKKGSFPSTAADVDDVFVFVSLDADLYELTIDCLRYFYQRMAVGRYTMIHHLMVDRYKGCRKAVYEFCDSMKISSLPIPDTICSTLILKY